MGFPPLWRRQTRSGDTALCFLSVNLNYNLKSPDGKCISVAYRYIDLWGPAIRLAFADSLLPSCVPFVPGVLAADVEEFVSVSSALAASFGVESSFPLSASSSEPSVGGSGGVSVDSGVSVGSGV